MEKQTAKNDKAATVAAAKAKAKPPGPGAAALKQK